jgi:hypothetical protein
MKRMFNFIILSFIALGISSCKSGVPSPTVAYIEVLDSDNNVIEDCIFSAKYKDIDLSDISVEVIEYSDEEFKQICKNCGTDNNIPGFTIGKKSMKLCLQVFQI